MHARPRAPFEAAFRPLRPLATAPKNQPFYDSNDGKNGF